MRMLTLILRKLIIKLFPSLLKDTNNYSKGKKPGLSKNFSNTNVPFKSNTPMKANKNSAKSNSQPVQYFECKGFGHVALQCANGKLKNKGKVLSVTWDDESTYSNSSEHDSKNSRLAMFMARSNSSSLQGASDKDSKSDDDATSHRFDNVSDDD